MSMAWARAASRSVGSPAGMQRFGLPVGIGLPGNLGFQVLADARIGRQILERTKGYFKIGFCAGFEVPSEAQPGPQRARSSHTYIGCNSPGIQDTPALRVK